jgi:hypothetical protein
VAPGAGRPARKVSVLARLAVALLIAGLVVQAGFMVREAHRQLTTPVTHPLRDFLQNAARLIPAGAGYAVTSPVRSDNARYFLYPRRQVVTGFDRASLERSGVRYVIVTDDARPATLRGLQPWYRVLLATPDARLLEVTG